MNLDLNLLGQAADVLYMKLYNPACQSQLIDCFMQSSVLIWDVLLIAPNCHRECLMKIKNCGKWEGSSILT